MSDYTQTTVSGFPGVNAELAKVSTAIASKLDDSNGSLVGTLDANEQRIINLPDPQSGSEPIPFRHVQEINGRVDEAIAAAQAAELAQDLSEQAANESSASADEAAQSAEDAAASAALAEARANLSVVPKTTGQVLQWGVVNSFQNTATVTIPLASTVAANTYLDIYVADLYKGAVITVNRSGSDLFNNGTTDTQLVVTFTSGGSFRIVSNGVSELRV